MRSDQRLRIIVLGYIVRGPIGGLAWHHLQYVLGLLRLGHDVYFMEDSEDYPACYDPTTNSCTVDPSYGLRFTEEAFNRLGLGARWTYFDAHRSAWLGPCAAKALSLCSDADVVINVSAVNPLRDWWSRIPVRVFVDTDPAFTQVRHLKDPAALERARAHTSFLTFGENIGEDRCSVPDDGLPWRVTRQPIVLDIWDCPPPTQSSRFTTIMQWESYPAREHGGIRYGQKSDSFAEYLHMPDAVGPVLELALGGSSAPKDLLTSKGWRLQNPLKVTETPQSYRRYIQDSTGEFSVAKQGYVVSWSGWFSERSAAYLASGRPVVMQDTGYSDSLPVGSGLFSFRTPAEAAAGIEAIRVDVHRHSLAAIELAREYFDSEKVLTRAIDLMFQVADASQARRRGTSWRG